jgi:uncharacterized protein (DUF1330 family)
MNVTNALRPDGTQEAALRAPVADGPIVMVNLLRFRDRAQYPDGRDADVTGRTAYQRYGVVVAGMALAMGGRILFVGRPRALVIGTVDDAWEEVAVVEYPSRRAFLQMIDSPEYQAANVHREAGLSGQILIETTAGFVVGT